MKRRNTFSLTSSFFCRRRHKSPGNLSTFQLLREKVFPHARGEKSIEALRGRIRHVNPHNSIAE